MAGLIRTTGGALLAVAVLALLGLAVFFRVSGTLIHPLWLDEAYSAYAAAHDWRFLWQTVPRYETHPPFYYSLLHVWTLALGDSLGSLRALGIVASLATLPVIALAGRELARIMRPGMSGPGVPLAALLLIAVAPYPIAMAHEVRPYPVMILVYAVACLALLRIGRVTAAGAPIPVRTLALYLAGLAAMLWLHNMGPLYAIAMTCALAVLVLRRSLDRRDWLLLIGGHAVVGLVYLPGFLILVDQAPTWVHSTWLKFTTDALRWRLSAIYVVPSAPGVIAAALLVVVALAALMRNDGGRRAAAALLLLAIVPIGLSIAISLTVSPVFIERTMAAVAIPGLLLIAAAAGGGRSRIPAWLLLALLVLQMATLDWRRSPGRPSQDWYPAIRWLHARYRPGDIVLAYPNEGALPFDYAVRDLRAGIPSRPIPTAVPSLDVGGWHPTGSRGVVSLPRDRLRAIAQAPDVAAARTVWLLRLGANAYDKGDVFLDELSTGRREIAHYDRDPIDIIGLRRENLPADPSSP